MLYALIGRRTQVKAGIELVLKGSSVVRSGVVVPFPEFLPFVERLDKEKRFENLFFK